MPSLYDIAGDPAAENPLIELWLRQQAQQAQDAGQADQQLAAQGANVRSADLRDSQSPIVQRLLGQGMTRGLSEDTTNPANASGLTYNGPVSGYGGPTRASDAQPVHVKTAHNQAELDNILTRQEIDKLPGPGGKGTMGQALDLLGITKLPGLVNPIYPGLVTDPEQMKLQIARERNASQERIHGIGNSAASLPVGASPEDILKSVDAGTAALVKKVANYEIPISGFGGMDAKTRQKVLPLVAMYDPSFDANQYNARMKLRQDFTSGKSAQNIRSLNTAVNHLDQLQTAAEKLDNSQIPLIGQYYNAAKNKASEASGYPEVTNFNNAATAVEGELANVFKNSGATDQEIKQWRQNLSTSQSPEQLKQGIQSIVNLMAGRLGAVKSQWETGMQKPAAFSILTKKSRDTLAKMGIDPNSVESQVPGAPAGGGEAKTLDKSTAQQYLQKAGGDRNKARALAKQDGYNF